MLHGSMSITSSIMACRVKPRRRGVGVVEHRLAIEKPLRAGGTTRWSPFIAATLAGVRHW